MLYNQKSFGRTANKKRDPHFLENQLNCSEVRNLDYDDDDDDGDDDDDDDDDDDNNNNNNNTKIWSFLNLNT